MDFRFFTTLKMKIVIILFFLIAVAKTEDKVGKIEFKIFLFIHNALPNVILFLDEKTSMEK